MRSYIATLDPHRSPDRVYFRDLTIAAQNACGLDTYPIYNLSNWDRYFAGESKEYGKYYVLSDDDVVPFKLTMFEEAIAIMEEHPNIGVLGFAWKPNLREEEVHSYVRGKRLGDSRLWEFDHVGGIRIVRRGFIENTLYPKPGKEDQYFCDMVRAKGYVVALASHLWFHHLGETFSTLGGIDEKGDATMCVLPVKDKAMAVLQTVTVDAVAQTAVLTYDDGSTVNLAVPTTVQPTDTEVDIQVSDGSVKKFVPAT